MHKSITACLGVLLLASISASSVLALDAAELAEEVNADVIEWRRDIHQNPELGNREFRTQALVAEHMESLGLEVRTDLGHTGVVGILRGGRPGPRIALRADMDALPVTEQVDLPFASTVTTEFRGQTTGVMHACGHDAHTAILMGVAQALASRRSELSGEVMFIFQPAEEGPPEGEEGGASLMIEQGLFEDFLPEAVFGLHVIAGIPSNVIALRSGPFMAAADSFRIVVRGRQTHGSRPWGGVDPIVAAADIVSTAQTVVSRKSDLTRAPVVVSFGAIQGGIRQNIIPDQVELIGTIRTFEEDMRARVFEELERIARQVAAAHGAEVDTEIPWMSGYPVTRNDPALTARMWPTLERVAEGRVIEIPAITGAEDFSEYGKHAPAMFIFVGATPPDQDPTNVPSNHSPLFFLDEDALLLGTRALLGLSLDYLQPPEPADSAP
ncbi:amidohydrolase [Wenzhouxiangella marina]|uniref:N-acyl-L-amino acid amidohydrolase n=1 Tax=Wenzhouxiangella marina TaxID=1579979 RepID=A0A0K0XW00_9GAMM|nr:amidohydrolase [Wenzhouxiangella marina]AKS41858.1 N-acyl-L-amino acid amidohydrolase [Wenzhouxiangella marina]MBB6086376.1 amidohydrolase [Wenzhouxiangella marina]